MWRWVVFIHSFCPYLTATFRVSYELLLFNCHDEKVAQTVNPVYFTFIAQWFLYRLRIHFHIVKKHKKHSFNGAVILEFLIPFIFSSKLSLVCNLILFSISNLVEEYGTHKYFLFSLLLKTIVRRINHLKVFYLKVNKIGRKYFSGVLCIVK